ncbi:MAG: MBL fold metallo-hydrolase [Candidatus Marinimicrobia bacterium]|nr:MBL fold metallo-hydrolase [Candidatus Neomarinimicrobiota bacterium]MDP6853239.1 MBL fold metallo-hydrolase [Candidatus Neomarinimicrobiota bacterium]
MLDSLGKWQVTPLETGDFRLDGGAMMGSVPKVLWEKTNPADELNRIDLALRCLLLDDGEKRILIESGLGDKIQPDFKKMFHVVQDDHPLEDCLNKKDLSKEDITHVILTHLHFDHAGGATSLDKNGSMIPAFPNAEYFVSETNWESGLEPNPRDRASYLPENYLPLEENGQLIRVRDNTDLFDGISTISVNGHTFGQQLIKVESEGEILVFCADLIPLKSHLKLPWIMGYDLNAILTLKEKTDFLNMAAKEGWWLWFYHDPKTVAVKISKGEKYFDVSEEVKRDFHN